ncbi:MULTISPECIES: response regulator [Aequorivita]|uniref:Response regulator n=1 Tax=Aequorivita iocasae TaxID=2803865 RepID=A0ABX7DX08_9FLAO|nr:MULTISPECIES: response regulator [Aequorivita]QQX77299.1 response regulator [Aequorivita iocasae]UCA56788.1 response regulator [Aequorivita sp. F7]
MTIQILLIDDDPVVNFIHSRIIQDKFPDHPIFTFQNGLTAIEYIKQNSHYSYLIFLDINMPIMDGWEFLETIAEDETNYDLQIHVLTSSLDQEDKSRASNNKQILSYINKPLKSNNLKDLLKYK